MDDGLATCADVEELNILEEQLRAEFNNEVDCVVDVPTFDYLGTKIDTSTKTKAELTMSSYIKEVLKERKITRKAATPAEDDLFKIDEESRVLDRAGKEKFHSNVAQLLYLSTRVRPDIMLPITFLCSRVSQPTEQDLKKLKRVLEYLNGTSDLGIMLGQYGADMGVTVYADASYAVHKDFKSHGGIVIFHNKGPALVKCSKQKIVTRSSTEAELVTLSDAVSLAAYSMNFLKGQGYDVSSTLMQDNTSTIRLAENGRSNSDRTRHIGVRYFFVKQYLEDGSMKMEHCPTKEMVADLLTKPLQGDLFRTLRDMLLGYTSRDGSDSSVGETNQGV